MHTEFGFSFMTLRLIRFCIKKYFNKKFQVQLCHTELLEFSGSLLILNILQRETGENSVHTDCLGLCNDWKCIVSGWCFDCLLLILYCPICVSLPCEIWSLSLLRASCDRIAIFSFLEGLGLTTTPAFRLVGPSQLIFRAKDPKSGGHIFLTS